MNIQHVSNPVLYMRSVAIGVLVSLVLFYAIHLFGSWTSAFYQPDPETTGNQVLYNKCAILGKTHNLHPGTENYRIGSGVDSTKAAGSFLIFFEGHILAMLIFSLFLGALIFLLRKRSSGTGT